MHVIENNAWELSSPRSNFVKSLSASSQFMLHVMVDFEEGKKTRCSFHSETFTAHFAYRLLNDVVHCLSARSLNKHVPHPSVQAPPPRLQAQLVRDQKESCKQPMKRVMLRMTPSLNYSVLYKETGPACCHHGGTRSYGHR